MHSWHTTRNTFEAAALASLDIPVKAVTMIDRKTGDQHTDWNLATSNQTGEAPPDRLFITGHLRRDFNDGKLQGELAAQPLHPYLIALRAMHNRARLLDAQHGKPMRQKEEAPGSFILEPGTSAAAVVPPFLDTPDMDLAVALIGIGCALAGITHNGNAHVYRLARYATLPQTMPGTAALDAAVIMQDLRSNALFPARRWEPFAIAIHALHCLRELRKRQHSDRFMTVRHRTYFLKGAAFKENAPDHILSHVQRTLGIRL